MRRKIENKEFNMQKTWLQPESSIQQKLSDTEKTLLSDSNWTYAWSVHEVMGRAILLESIKETSMKR